MIPVIIKYSHLETSARNGVNVISVLRKFQKANALLCLDSDILLGTLIHKLGTMGIPYKMFDYIVSLDEANPGLSNIRDGKKLHVIHYGQVARLVTVRLQTTEKFEKIIFIGNDSDERFENVIHVDVDSSAGITEKDVKHITSLLTACIVCGTRAQFACGKCKSVFYCSVACQKRHWSDIHGKPYTCIPRVKTKIIEYNIN